MKNQIVTCTTFEGARAKMCDKYGQGQWGLIRALHYLTITIKSLQLDVSGPIDVINVSVPVSSKFDLIVLCVSPSFLQTPISDLDNIFSLQSLYQY